MLNSDFDHLSVWELAHRWHDQDPNLTDPMRLPLGVQDSLRIITRALTYGDISVCDSGGVQKKNPNEHMRRAEFINSHEADDDPYPPRDENGIEIDPLETDKLEALVHEDITEQYVAYVDRWCGPHWRLCEGLELCFKGREYDREKLESVHVNQENLIFLCRLKRLPLPEFWFNEDERQAFKAGLDSNDVEKAGRGIDIDLPESEQAIALEHMTQPIIDDLWGKMSSKQKHRLLCREIADELWRQDSSISITAMMEHPAIQQYGGGRYYTGKNTLRDWVKDMPNRPDNHKGGRPPKQSAQ